MMSTSLSGIQLQNLVWIERAKTVTVFLIVCSVVAAVNLAINNPGIHSTVDKVIHWSYCVDLFLAGIALLAFRSKTRLLLLPITIKQILEILGRAILIIIVVKFFAARNYTFRWHYNEGIVLVTALLLPLHILMCYCFVKCYKALSPNRETAPVELVESNLLSA